MEECCSGGMIDSAEYWNRRYIEGNTPWDLGYPSPALMDYVRNHASKETKILIPGGGHTPELPALWDEGYRHVYVCDWSEKALEYAKSQNVEIPEDRFILGDFFKLEDDFDLILEQTFFCAISPRLRSEYAQTVARLLQNNKGELAGVFFHRDFEHDGPPFGGFEEDYLKVFSPHLNLVRSGMNEKAINPRMGSELFMVWKSA